MEPLKENAMRIQAEASKVAAKARDLYSASRKVTRNGAKEAKSFIHARPVLSVFLGVGAGFLLARIFGSGDSD